MKFSNAIPATLTTLYTANEPTLITTITVDCGNTAGQSFQLRYVQKAGNYNFLFPKVFTPPIESIVVCPRTPFTMEPGDSIQGSASDATQFGLLID